MAWNPSPKIATCRDVARKYSKEQVIIIMFDRKNNTMECASYGTTKLLCHDAGVLADCAFDAVMEKEGQS